MPSRALRLARSAFEVVRDALKGFGEDRGGRMAAALAYRTLFAIAPLLLLALGVFALVVGDAEEAKVAVLGAIGSLVGSAATEAIESLVGSAVRSDATAVVGLALFAWGSSSLFIDLQASLSDVFRVPQERRSGWRAWVRSRLIAIAWSVGFGVLFLVIWVVNAAGGWLAGLLPEALGATRQVVALVTRLLTVALAPAVFMLMYRTMIRTRLDRRAVLVGSVITAAIFVATAYGAAAYFSWDRDTTAGRVAGSVVVLLLLAYFLATALLLGAEVTRVCHHRFRSK
ncbi:MAG: YihY/virulence factor BrkB family protein [Actinomycetes bacterium]